MHSGRVLSSGLFLCAADYPPDFRNDTLGIRKEGRRAILEVTVRLYGLSDRVESRLQ